MTKNLTKMRLKLNAKLFSAMSLIGCILAGQCPVTALAGEFDWLTKEPENGGIFGNVTDTVKEAGASGYQLILAVSIIGLLCSIMWVGFNFVTKKNATQKEENKSHLIWIAIGGIIIFGASAILSLLKTMGSGLEF